MLLESNGRLGKVVQNLPPTLLLTQTHHLLPTQAPHLLHSLAFHLLPDQTIRFVFFRIWHQFLQLLFRKQSVSSWQTFLHAAVVSSLFKKIQNSAA
jgi:hypothetical protein